MHLFCTNVRAYEIYHESNSRLIGVCVFYYYYYYCYHFFIFFFLLVSGQSRIEMTSTREVFVVTELYRRGLQGLSSSGVLVISGPPGSGKSCLAHALLRHHADHDDHTPLIVKSYEEWRLHVGGGDSKQVVLLDHVLGREELDRSCLRKWTESLETLRAFASEDTCMAILTVNDHVLAEAGIAAGSTGAELFHHAAVVDLSSAQPYTAEEKTAMLQKHLSRKGKAVPPQLDLDGILHKDVSGPFFPSLCKQYANTVSSDANADDIFADKQISSRRGRRPKTTPIHTACYNGDIKAVSAFLEAGVNTEVVNVDGNTPLHTASRRGHADIVQTLSAKCTPFALNMRNLGGQAPLDVACDCGNTSVARILLEHGASLNEMPRAKTPLHIACERGCLELVKTLLEHGANVNHADLLGQTPLHCVLEDRGKFQDPNLYGIVKLLLQYNADVNLANHYGSTPLDLVFMYSQNECIQKTILLHMAENDKRTNTGATAIHMACQFCDEGVVRYIVQKFSKLDLNVRDNDGVTPLLAAVQSKSPFRTKIIQYLLDGGADINAMDHTGLSPFEEYVKSDHELLGLFVKHGANVHRLDSFGNTLLHHACQSEMHKRGLYVLIAYGVGIHSKNHHGDTPLHIACAAGNREAVRVLLNLGSSTGAHNEAGKSPMDIAFDNNHSGLLSLMMYSQMKRSGHKRSAAESHHSEDVSEKTRTGERVSAKNCAHQRVDEQMTFQESQTRINKERAQFKYGSQHAERSKKEVLADSGKEGYNCLTNQLSRFVTTSDTFHSENRESSQKSNNGCSNIFLASFSNDPDDVEALQYEASLRADTAVASADVDSGLCDMDRQTQADTDRGLRFKSQFRQTRLHDACITCDVAAAEALLEENHDVNLQDKNGQTPLHCASTHGHIIMVDLLLQQGSKVNVTDHRGQSPLHLACCGNKNAHSSIAAVLLNHGADVNCVDGNGETPLHVAGRKGYHCVVAVLVGRGAAVNCGDGNGNTALHLAAFYGHIEAGLLLLQSGARVTTRNRQGDTALALAVSAQHTTLVKVLERHAYFNASRTGDGHPNCVCWRKFFLLPALVLILTWMCGIV